MQNTATFVFTHNIGTMMNMLGKFAIIALNMSMSYWLISSQAKYKDTYLNLNSVFDPIYLMFVESLIISQLFMGMYTTMSACMLHCLFQDIAQCHEHGYDVMNGKERPRCVKRLIKLLMKREEENQN
jgi:hypothetical protein